MDRNQFLRLTRLEDIMKPQVKDAIRLNKAKIGNRTVDCWCVGLNWPNPPATEEQRRGRNRSITEMNTRIIANLQEQGFTVRRFLIGDRESFCFWK